MEKPRKIGLFNNKGGVAKTTSVINIAYFLQKSGYTVLVVDCDMQENCFNFFLKSQNSDEILATDYENIFHTTWERYQNAVTEEFDYILFDCPATFSDEVRTIIRHCDVIYVPTILGEFEIAGLKKVTDEIHTQGTRLGGIFVTMYRPKNDREIIEDFRGIMEEKAMETVIPYSETVRESQKANLPLEPFFEHKGVPKINKNSWKIVQAYHDLTSEILRSVG